MGIEAGLPALLLQGTEDEVVPHATGVKLATVLLHARLITVAGGHHHDLFLGGVGDCSTK